MGLEYRHVRFDYGWLGALDRRSFDERMQSVLDQAAAGGWELKGCFHDFGCHVHLIFCREVQKEQKIA
jgi:hypothetical protein